MKSLRDPRRLLKQRLGPKAAPSEAHNGMLELRLDLTAEGMVGGAAPTAARASTCSGVGRGKDDGGGDQGADQ
jgi:hypothetical protein